MYLFALEFSSSFLVDLVDCVFSCRFGNFFCNRQERGQKGELKRWHFAMESLSTELNWK
ncbi:hypothetical protein Tsubulata_040393 [Turnera subulata]|uniref:Myotubularin phosphatase domain-containing protein n=1 Tax=Turnera subulata TaxID=218843 RepID=A0A9Q0FQ84_9ROSI|nr:hypothetical protein Tsubulata_040393 [Turnera subulata]